MIRKATLKDIGTIMDIWLDTNIKTHSFVDEKYWHQNYNEVRMAILSTEVYVFDETGVKGFVGVVENYIAGIFVKELYQSQGIGNKLICYLQQKKPELILKVYEKNKKAVDFYLKSTFQISKNNWIRIQTKWSIKWFGRDKSNTSPAIHRKNVQNLMREEKNGI